MLKPIKESVGNWVPDPNAILRMEGEGTRAFRERRQDILFGKLETRLNFMTLRNGIIARNGVDQDDWDILFSEEQQEMVDSLDTREKRDAAIKSLGEEWIQSIEERGGSPTEEDIAAFGALLAVSAKATGYYLFKKARELVNFGSDELDSFATETWRAGDPELRGDLYFPYIRETTVYDTYPDLDVRVQNPSLQGMGPLTEGRNNTIFSIDVIRRLGDNDLDRPRINLPFFELTNGDTR